MPASGARSSRSKIQGASPSTPLDARVVGGRDRDRAAHREADEQRPLAAGRRDRRARVLDAEVELPPRLDPVAHLGEAELGKRGASVRDEPLERRAPGARHLAGLAAVDADDHALGAGAFVSRSSAPVASRTLLSSRVASTRRARASAS